MALDCPKINLRYGENNDNVKEMQQKLQTLGFYTGYKLDGIWKDATETAVKAFQKRYGLKVDGVFGEISCNKLTSLINTIESAQKTTDNIFDCNNTSLQEGSTDTKKVLILQTYLKDWGYYCSACKLDGIFGPETKKAVEAFQKATGNTVDGWFGSQTCPAFVKKVKQENSADVEKHELAGKGFWALPPHVRKWQAKLTVLPKKVEVSEVEIETVEDVDTTDTSTEDTEDTEDTDADTTTETTPQVTTTTVTRYNMVSLNAKGEGKAGGGLNCSGIKLYQGAKGEQVITLQTGLSSLGYYTRSIDGDFGPKTDEAVRAFQAAKGLGVDGVVGEQTCPAFNKAIGADTDAATGDEKDEYTFENVYNVSFNTDADGLTAEGTLRIPYTEDVLKHIQIMQCCRLEYHADVLLYHEPVIGYINDIKLVQENNLFQYEISFCNLICYLECELVDYQGTKKQTQHLKDICKEIGLDLVLDVDDLPDEDFEVNPTTTVNARGGTGGGQTVNVSGNDCDASDKYQSHNWGGKHKCNPPLCTEEGKKIRGNSSRNYAKDTASHNSSLKELVEFVEAKCQYQLYANNPHGSSKCPENMWNSGKSGKITGNCADFARMMKCICDVNGYKCIICHIPGHFYNAVWENGGWTLVDLCAKTCWGIPSYGHANHGDIKPRGTWDSPVTNYTKVAYG